VRRDAGIYGWEVWKKMYFSNRLDDLIRQYSAVSRGCQYQCRHFSTPLLPAFDNLLRFNLHNGMSGTSDPEN
jgi:hypothetical protein